MRTIELELSSADSAESIVHLVWRGGRVEVRFVAEELRASLDRWLAHGVREWVETADGRRVARITASTEVAFLRRLAADLRRQFNFSVALDDRDEPTPRADRLTRVVFRRPSVETITLAPDSRGRIAAAARGSMPRVPATATTYEWRP